MDISSLTLEIHKLKAAGKTPRMIVCSCVQMVEFKLNAGGWTPRGYLPAHAGGRTEIMGIPVTEVKVWSGANVLDQEAAASFWDKSRRHAA